MIYRDFVALPIFIFFALCVVLGEMGSREHRRAELLQEHSDALHAIENELEGHND